MSSDGEPRGAGVPFRPRWGLGDAAAGFAFGFVLSALLASIWLGATGKEDLGLGGQAVSELGLWTGLVGCVVLASRRKGAGRLETDFGLAGRLPDLPLGVVAGVLAQTVLVPGVAFLMRPLVGRPDVSGPAEDLFEQATGVGTVVLVLFVVVGAPLVEELFFRGLVLRALERRIGPTPAILVSAVLFGIVHLQPLGPKALTLVIVTLVAFGVVLGVLTVRTGRLGPALVTHSAFNAWTAVMLLTK